MPLAFTTADAWALIYILGAIGLLAIVVAIWPTEPPWRCWTYFTGLGTCGGTILFGSVLALYSPSSPAPSPSPHPPVIVPANGHLADLVPAPQQHIVGAFYRDLAAVALTAANIQTTDQLRDGYRNAGAILKQVGRLPSGLADFAAAADAVLTSALGKQSKPLTDVERRAFASACLSIAAELGVQP